MEVQIRLSIGPLTKSITNATSFNFPIGQGITQGHQLILSDATGAGTGSWTAQYFSPNPTYTLLTSPLQAVNDIEYWGVKATGARTANISLGWSPTSDLTPLMTVNGLSDMNVTQFITGSWQQLASTPTGSTTNGTVVTNSGVSFVANVQANFTTASITTTAPKATLNPSAYMRQLWYSH